MQQSTRRGFLGSLGVAGIGVSAYVSPSRTGTEEDLSAPVPSGTWPMPGRTPQRSGYQPESAGPPEEHTRAWRQESARYRGAAVANRDALFTSGPTALSTTDGSKRWGASLPGVRYLRGIALWEGTLYATTPDRLYAFDAGSGSSKWARPESDLTVAFVAGPTVVCTSPSTETIGLDAKTGATRWRLPDHGDPMLATRRTIGFHTGSRGLTGIDPTTGSVEWTAEGISDGTGRGIAANDGVVYGNHRDVVGFEIASDTVLWRAGFDLEQSGTISLVTDGDRVYGAGYSRAFALDAATGDTDWDRTLDDVYPYFEPAVTDDALYVGSESDVVALDPETGSELARFSPPRDEPDGDQPLLGQLLVAGGQVYYVDRWQVVAYR